LRIPIYRDVAILHLAYKEQVDCKILTSLTTSTTLPPLLRMTFGRDKK
jgi:hypothetical protein